MPGRIGRSIMIGCFALFVLFLYGPTLTIMILSFQGPDGGLTFPMNGASLHWFANLFERQAVGDFGGSIRRSVMLGLMVMATTVVVSVLAGLAFRRRFRGAGVLFTLTVASLIVPSILVGLGIGLLFNLAGWDPAWYRFGVRRTTDLDAAVRAADHVRRAQSVRSPLGGSGARSRCQPMADVPLRRAADHRARRCRASRCSASRCPTTSSPARC